MAEAEQPKKGSTSKFKDALGKTDLLIYNALGINVQSLLNALGIESLADLKNVRFDTINWGALLQILYALNPAQLKQLLSRLNLNSFNLRSLLSILGVPADVVNLLSYIQGMFSEGGGIFTGGTNTLGISNTFVPSSGWLPGDPEYQLDINNPPITGLVLRTPDDPNNPDYVTPGSENLLNVLAGVNSAEEAITATMPQSGIGEFYYQYIKTPIRFESSKFFPFSEAGGYDMIRSYFARQLGYIPEVEEDYVGTNEKRVDLISYDSFGSTQYYWIIMMYNGITDINQLTPGQKLKIPSRDALEQLYFTVKSQGNNV
ncbi:MAG: hypothetical protein IJH34_09590 [Romboutsia sp.]|nr:hypothetical protein [Romboutsia sp.]